MLFSLGRPAAFPSPDVCRIMVVDHRTAMLESMMRSFRPYGFAPIAASSAEDAVRQAGTFLPQAVYIAMSYSDGKGWELADRLRKIEGMKNAVLVGLCDCKKRQDSLTKIASDGFDRYLPHPPRIADIVAVLSTKIP